MVDFNTKRAVDTYTENYELYVRGPARLKDVFLDAATAGYVPVVGDVICRKSDDTNKHQKWDPTDAALVILGVIDNLESDNTGTAVVKIGIALDAWVNYAALGITGGVPLAADKLILKDGLRAVNIDVAG